MYDWSPTNVEANENTAGGTVLISVSELCFDSILARVVLRRKDTTHSMRSVPRFPVVYRSSLT